MFISFLTISIHKILSLVFIILMINSILTIIKIIFNQMLKQFASLILILGFIGVIHYYTLPDPLQNLDVPYKFKIYRDTQNNIPKVVARDQLSIYFGMGFAEAQDRLWTLFLKKMIVQGRVSELFGEATLPLDFQMRNYGFFNVGKMNQKVTSEETKRKLQAYVDGINSYAKIQNYLPFEFYLAWGKWEDWTIETSLSQIALASFVLQFDWLYEIARQRLLETVGFDLAWKMMPFGENNLFREVTILSEEQLKQLGKYKYYNTSLTRQILMQHWVNKTLPIGSVHLPDVDYQSLGSNAWVVGGQYTQNGKPLLANDPHLGLLAPSLLYMIEFILLEKDSNEIRVQAMGAMLDGVPSISMGTNGKVAWGSTASYVDNKDVYHEKVRSKNGRFQYFFKGEWKPFKVRRQVFKVRGGDDVVNQFYQNHRGPVIEDIFMDLHYKYGYPIPSAYRENHTLTISSAIYSPDNISAENLLKLAFREKLNITENSNCPNIDFVWIDLEGNWGYSPIGRIPIRQVPEMGSFVKDGTTDLFDMKEWKNFEEYPYIMNPKKGYVSMANNKYAQDSLDDRSSLHELTTGRSYRLQKIIKQKISKGEKFNFETMKEMQRDLKDQFLSEAFPGVLTALQNVREIWSNPKTEVLYKKLKEWDYFMPITSVEASIYHVFEHSFHEKLLHNTKLYKQEREAIINHAFFQIYLLKLYEKIGNQTLNHEEARACTNQDTSNYTQYHPCVVNAALTFKDLPALLQKVFGHSNTEEYHWGKIHKHVFKSVPFSEIPGLKHIWTRQTPAGGNSRTLNVGILTHQTKSYNSIAGPVFRFITDLNRTIFSFDLGQSDRPWSKYYDNFLGADRYFEYVAKNPLKENMTNWELSASHQL